MRLLKGLVLGLLLERGLGQTDTQPDGDSIATVADPVETDPADVPAPDPTVPSDGDTPSDPPDPADDGPTITLDDPQPTDDGSDARIPAPDPTDQPTDVEDPSAIPDDPAETNTDDEQQAPTDQPAPTDTEPAPAPTDVDATQTDEETPQETDTNGEEATQTDGDTDAAPVVPTEALNSAAEETPEATPLASDTADDQVTQTTEEPSDEETEEPTADSEPEESTQQKTRNLVAPTNTENSDAKTTDGDGNYSPAPYASPTGGDEAEQTGDSEQTADGTTRKAAATGSGGKEEKTTLATSKGAAPTSPAQDYAIDLKEADLGDYAEFQGAGDKTVVVLKPPPNTEAKCDLPPTSDEDVPEGEDVRVVLAVKIAGLKKGVKSGNRLQMLVDGSTIYDKELLGTGDEEESISSDKFRAALDQKVNVIHKAGDKPVQVTIQDANIRSAVSAGSREGSGGGSGGGSGSGDDGDDSGDDDSGSGGGGSGSGSGGGSGGGSGDSSGDSSGGGASESASGTGDEGSSPSSTSGSDGQTNVAGKNFMVGEVLVYALPLALALMG